MRLIIFSIFFSILFANFVLYIEIYSEQHILSTQMGTFRIIIKVCEGKYAVLVEREGNDREIGEHGTDLNVEREFGLLGTQSGTRLGADLFEIFEHRRRYRGIADVEIDPAIVSHALLHVQRHTGLTAMDCMENDMGRSSGRQNDAVSLHVFRV